MEKIAGFDYVPLTFDAAGALQSAAEFKAMLTHVDAAKVTDAIFIAHGFRNDVGEASRLYTSFMTTFRANAERPELRGSLAGRQIVVAGVLWPSKSFAESFNDDDGRVQGLDDEPMARERVMRQLENLRDQDATPAQRPAIDRALALLPMLKGKPDLQDEFVALVLSLLDGADPDQNEGLDQIRAQPGSELLEKLGSPIILPTSKDDEDGGAMSVGRGPRGGPAADSGGAQSLGGFFGSIAGRVGQFLNLTTWYLMKERSGTVGATGVAAAVRELKKGRDPLKVHLVGHSLGGRLMAGCAKSLCAAPMVRPASLTLLEAAFSHYGFSPDNGRGVAGFFRDVMKQELVAGPFVSTFSFQDTVVGKAYAVASRLAGDNAKAVGDANDPFGGIGRNGTQKTTESTTDVLHAPGVAYTFKPKVVNNLDGSGGLIKNHGDVVNAHVTYAFASAMAAT